MDWIEHFSDHAVHQTLQDLEETISTCRASKKLADPAQKGLDRLRHVARFVGHYLKAADPLLVAPGTLDNTNSLLAQVSAQLQLFISNNNIGHIDAANNEANKLFPQISFLFRPGTPKEIEELKSVLEAFDASAKSLTSSLEQRTQAAEQTVTALNAEVQKTQETIKSEKVRIDQAIAQHQQQFSESQATRQQSSSEVEKARTERAETQHAKWEGHLSAAAEKQEKQAESHIGSIKGDWNKFKEALREIVWVEGHRLTPAG